MERADARARRMWRLFEPVHVVTYFAAEARAAFEDAGLRGFWRGYFAGRSAPLGPATAAPVTAAFYNFSPAMVARALPGVWELISPVRALEVRSAGAVAALRRLLTGLEDSIPEAAELLAAATAGLDFPGRVLGAANGALPVPDEPVARLWHAATVLREHRGDGHFAALLGADIDGCEALVLRSAADLPREQIQPLRGWTDGEWDAAAARLADRGLLRPDGTTTSAGAELSSEVERVTDTAAARPWRDEHLTTALAELLLPIAVACAAELPYPNPVGVPEPTGGKS